MNGSGSRGHRSPRLPQIPLCAISPNGIRGSRGLQRPRPPDLTDRQVAKLADIQKTNKPLYRGYLLKEQLRQIYRLPTDAAIKHGLSNARVEAINTQIRMITRRAFGFHSPDALIALAMLSLSGLCPPLPR